jgi:hypothetical protein
MIQRHKQHMTGDVIWGAPNCPGLWRWCGRDGNSVQAAAEDGGTFWCDGGGTHQTGWWMYWGEEQQ